MSPRPGSRIVVIEDIDPPAGFGAFWGEVHSNIHKGLGGLGVITQRQHSRPAGLRRRLQMLAGVVGPSHAYVHSRRSAGR